MTNQAHSSSDLKKSGEIVSETYKDIEQLQKRLFGEMETLMSGWNGQAAQTFMRSYQAFNEEFTDVQRSLETFHGKLVDANIQYDRNEAEQTQAAQNLMALLNK